MSALGDWSVNDVCIVILAIGQIANAIRVSRLQKRVELLSPTPPMSGEPS